VALFACLGSFTYAFNSVIFGSVLGLPSFFDYHKLDSSSSYGASIIEAANRVFTAGGFFGCLLIHWMSDALGRRLSIQLVAVLCVVSGALQAGSVHIPMFLVGRVLSSFGCRMSNSLIPLYLSEISPPAKRGRITGFHGALEGVAYVSYRVKQDNLSFVTNDFY
jgi:MFS family permease